MLKKSAKLRKNVLNYAKIVKLRKLEKNTEQEQSQENLKMQKREQLELALKNGRKTEKLFIIQIFGFYFNTFKRKSDEDQTQQETQQELIKVGLEHCNLCVQAGGEGCT